MAAKCSCRLPLVLLSLLAVYSTGTLVVAGYSFVRTVKFSRIIENEIPVCGSSHHLFLDGTVVDNLIFDGVSGVSSLKSSIVTSLHHTRLDGIVLDFGKRSGDLFELRRILSAARSVSETLGEIRFEDDDCSIKLSVVFSTTFLEKLGREYGRDHLHSLFNAFQNVLRMVILEGNSFRIESGRGEKVASSLADRAPIQAIPFTTPNTSTPTIVTVPGTSPVTVTPNIIKVKKKEEGSK